MTLYKALFRDGEKLRCKFIEITAGSVGSYLNRLNAHLTAIFSMPPGFERETGHSKAGCTNFWHLL
jgi:hypothetical protein